MQANAVHTASRVSDIPPLRADPFTAEPKHDAARAEFVIGKWHEQDELLRRRDRQVEENIRMLCGQQWIVWSEMRGRYVDVSKYLTDDEKRWRQLPVMNRLLLWFMLLHARMTENPPVLSWLPGPDRIDAELASVMDPIFKHLWHETGMLEKVDSLFSWMIPSGRAFLKSRIDPNAGEPFEFRGDALLRLLDPSGNPVMDAQGQPIERMAEGVPFDQEGNPQARLVPHEGDYGFELTGDPFIEMEGAIKTEVLSCLEVRGEWGPKSWHEKSYHIQRSFLTPEEFFEAFGVEAEPDVTGASAENVGTLMRLIQGTGLFGAAEGRDRTFGGDVASHQEYVTVYEYWQRPSRRQDLRKTPDNPGGRQTVVTGSKDVIRDGNRYAPFSYTSPIRCFDFVNIPGRPQGTSPQEMLNGPQRTRNRLDAQILQHATLVANPTQVIDKAAGIEEGQLKNIPGQQVWASFNGNDIPIKYTVPPQLTRDVYEGRQLLTHEIDSIGNIAGSEGTPPHEDASGELVKELRFNSDRFVGPTMRRSVLTFGRMAEDWTAMVPIVWDREKILTTSGEDNIVRAIKVYPELFREGKVNVKPEVESMLPEGRGERQARVHRFWQEGVWGDPMSVEARSMFLDLSRFPHMSAATRPGGIDRTMAEQNVGKLLQGVPALPDPVTGEGGIPILEVYDHDIHLFVLERFMKSPEYLKIDPRIQQQFNIHRQNLVQASLAKNARMMEREAAMAAQQATAEVAIQAGAQKQAEDAGIAAEPDEGEGDTTQDRSSAA